MKLIRYTYALLLVIHCSFGSAQITLPKNELDDKYTPNASSMFNNLVKKAYDENSYIEIEFKNVAKFCPTLLTRQKVFFCYERALYKGLVGVGGIGKAFGKDIFQNAFIASGLSRFSDGSSLEPKDAMATASYLGSSPLLHLGAKLYFSGTAFEEAFFEMNYRRERIDYLLPQLINGNIVDGENDIQFKMNAFSVGFGFTSVSGDKNNFVHEFFINFGLKSFKFTHYDFLNVQNPVTLKNELTYRKADDFLSVRILPSLNIGYALGFGW